MNKSATRIQAEEIQKVTKQSLVMIHFQGMQFVQSGLVKSLSEAYTYMISIL